MNLAKTLLATVAVLALAGPAFAQANPTLSTTATTTQAAVTTTIAPACAISTTLATFTVAVNPNGAVTTAAPSQTVKVTCNTPDGNITIGSNDMQNLAAPAIVETTAFTNTIRFTGEADGTIGSDGWAIDSRVDNPFFSSATIGYDTTRRIRDLVVAVKAVAPADGKLPVAGAYLGAICLTVTPAGALVGTGGANTSNGCV